MRREVIPLLILLLLSGAAYSSAQPAFSTGAVDVPPEQYSAITNFHFKPLTADNYLQLIEAAPSYSSLPPILKGALIALARNGPSASPSIPSSVNNSLYLPPVGNQGFIGSCNAWASTYYVWTYMLSWFRGEEHPNTPWTVMNPTFTYNLINDGRATDVNGDGRLDTSGTIIEDAMNLISTVGAIPYGAFRVYNGIQNGSWDGPWNQTLVNWYYNNVSAYNDWILSAISVWPGERQWALAPGNRGDADMYYSASLGGSPRSGVVYVINMTNETQFSYLKGLLAAGYVAETSIMVYDDFRNFNGTNDVYALNGNHTGNPGGHAVTIVGYDDNITTPDGKGALLMVNSWGRRWGAGGYWWLTYQAATDPNHRLSSGRAYVFLPLKHQPYEPRLLALLRIEHPKRGEVIGGLLPFDCPSGSFCYPPRVKAGFEVGSGSLDSPIWVRDFFNLYIAYHSTQSELGEYQAHPFPDEPITLDLTDSLSALSNSSKVDSQYVPFYIRIADKDQDGVTGSLDSFSILVNSTYLHAAASPRVSLPLPIPENGSWLNVSAEVPVLDYTGSTPLQAEIIGNDWVYVEVGSVVNMSGALLSFAGRSYAMTLDGPYHAFYNVTGLDNGTYAYSVTVTLKNGNEVVLPERTVYVNTEKGSLSVPIDSSQWEDEESLAPGEKAYINGTFVWKDLEDSGASPFTGRAYNIRSLQVRYDPSSGMLYMKFNLGPLDVLGRAPAPLLKVYFDTNGDGAWDYYAVADLAKEGVLNGVPAVLDLYNGDGAQVATPQTLFVPVRGDSSVFIQIPGDVLSISGGESITVKAELYEHDDLYGPLDELNGSDGSDTASVNLQQVPLFSKAGIIAVALLIILALFRRR